MMKMDALYSKYILSNDLKNFTNDFCDLNVDGQISQLEIKKMM